MRNKKFSIGDLVKITYDPMDGDLGVIIKQATKHSGPCLDHSRVGGEWLVHWLVHLTDGRDVWFRTDELRKLS